MREILSILTDKAVTLQNMSDYVTELDELAAAPSCGFPLVAQCACVVPAAASTVVASELLGR